MTRGVLIFAFNGGSIDYVEMAINSAKRVKAYLNKPVSLITDSKEHLFQKFPNDAQIFDKIIDSVDINTQEKRFYDGENNFQKNPWKNSTRANAYELTPYDETLVIDSDFIVSSNFLNYCWDQYNDFLIYDEHCDLSGWRNTDEFRYISNRSIKFYWATVFFFRKSNLNECFFSLIENIKNNWIYYVSLYKLSSTKFRNDFAFSIAIHMMNGFTNGNFATPLANKLHYVLDRDFLIEINNDTMKFLVQKENQNTEYTVLKVCGLDVHVMNKPSLLRAFKDNLNV